MSPLIWLFCTAAALAADPVVDLPALADTDGLSAVVSKLADMKAGAKSDKKYQASIAASGLEKLQIPVQAILGAELTVSTFTELTGCAITDDGITCRFGGTVAGKVEAGEYTAICKSKYGSTKPLQIELLAADDARAAWQATNVEACFEINATSITVQPKSHGDLEGVGAGTEFIPPELTGLTWGQVEKIILKTVPTFRICYQGRDSGPQNGKIVIAFEIGADGSLARTDAETSTVTNKEIEACILERFARITFPAPMDGFTKGTFPFNLQ